MGQYADDIINGNCDWSGDYTHKDNMGKSYRPRKLSPAEKNIERVRKELAILIIQKKFENDPNPVTNARKDINLKYGKGWRERGLVSNSPDQWKPLNEYSLTQE